MVRSNWPQLPRVTVHVVALAGVAFLAALGESAHAQNTAPGEAVERESVDLRLGMVAVVPFANISSQPDDDWIGTGIAETLLAAFDGAGVSVVGRRAVSAERAGGGAGQGSSAAGPAREAGRRLGPRWVIRGGYQRLGDRIRITARVVEAATGTVVHTAIVDGTVPELFALQDQLAAELRRWLPAGGGAGAPAAPAPTTRTPVNAAVEPVPPAAVGAPAAAAGSGVATAATTLIDGPPPPVPPAVVSRDAAGRVTMRAIHLTTPLRLDGQLDESIYGLVPPVSDFIQAEPQPGAPATERTELWVTFDGDNVYLSFRCWESRPERMVANEMRRDNSNIWQGNDIVAFMLDTFYDRRNSVVFTVNALGGRQDGQGSAEQGWNPDWNPVWRVEVGRFESGWTVEVAIPFKSLRYRPGRAQVWGINVLRTNRWKNNELSFLTRVPAGRGQPILMQASLAGTLVGLEAPPGSRNLEVKPYGISNLSSDVAAVPRISNEWGGDIGLDVKYGITQNVTADITFNTDFAQVEADEQQVNLTRFSLFFPEKREFFLENRGLYGFGGGSGRDDTPILFYSRRIGLNQGRRVPILAGGKVTGRLQRYSFGVLNIHIDDEPVTNLRSTNFSVIRMRRDILRRSNVGFIVTNRSVNVGGTDRNTAYGVDANFGFFDNLAITTFWARTYTPELSGKDISYRAQLDYTGDRYGVRLEHLAVGDHFNPGVGFVRRNDIRRTAGEFRFSPRLRDNEVVRKLSWTGTMAYLENGSGRVEARDWAGEFGIEFQNSDAFSISYNGAYEFVPAPFRIASGVTVPIGGYEFAGVRAQFTGGRQRRVSGTVAVEHTTFYSGRKTAISTRQGRLNPTSQLSIEPAYSINWVDLAEGAFRTHLVGSRLTYTMTPLMFVSALLQYSSDRHTVSANARLRWEYQPGSELFLVYTEERDTLARRFPDMRNRAFIVKFNRLFRF